MEPVSLLSIIGGIISIAFLILKLISDRNARKRKEQDDLDKEIDDANSFDDFVRIDDKLRDK